METKPIIEFKGTNGKLELYDKFLRIDRWTGLGFMMHGLKGKKDIYFKSITSVQIKKPGLTAGYIQLSIPGGIESKKGWGGSFQDENTITFLGIDKYKKVVEIKEYIEQKNSDSGTRNSDADEIEKLHSLMKKGIISKDEFEQKKKRLL